MTVLERALAAESAAERELSAIPDWLWNGEELPVPVETVADSHYGLLVREETGLASYVGLPERIRISGLLFPAIREIWVDAQEASRAPVRRRFTIGHELGHWVLHCDLGRSETTEVHCRGDTVTEEGAVDDERGHPKLAGATRYPQSELDANQFSAAILMPRALVEAEHAWVDGDARRLAEAFGVSTMAMEKRLWFLERYLKFGVG